MKANLLLPLSLLNTETFAFYPASLIKTSQAVRRNLKTTALNCPKSETHFGLLQKDINHFYNLLKKYDITLYQHPSKEDIFFNAKNYIQIENAIDNFIMFSNMGQTMVPLSPKVNQKQIQYDTEFVYELKEKLAIARDSDLKAITDKPDETLLQKNLWRPKF